MEEIMEKIKEANEDQPKMTAKLHVESYADGEKVGEVDGEYDGYVVMAFKGINEVTIGIHGCSMAQIAAAIDEHEELSEAETMVANRRAGEALLEHLQRIRDKHKPTEK